MERIFESLAENVSEECYNEIIGIVEEEIKKYRTGLNDSTIDSLLSKRKSRLAKAISDTMDAKKAAGMQPFTAYTVFPKKVEKAIKNQHKTEDKLHKTIKAVKKIRNEQ